MSRSVKCRRIGLMAFAVVLLGSAAGAQVIAEGTLRVSPDAGAATASVANLAYRQFTARATVPADVGRTVGRTLVVELRDASRPGQRCAAGPQQADVMLAGCAAVNWPDSTRPSFSVTNRLRLPLAGGGTTALNLRIDRSLRTQAEPPAS